MLPSNLETSKQVLLTLFVLCNWKLLFNTRTPLAENSRVRHKLYPEDRQIKLLSPLYRLKKQRKRLGRLPKVTLENICDSIRNQNALNPIQSHQSSFFFSLGTCSAAGKALPVRAWKEGCFSDLLTSWIALLIFPVKFPAVVYKGLTLQQGREY